MTVRWKGNMESTAGSPSSENGLRGRWAPPHTVALDLMLTNNSPFYFDRNFKTKYNFNYIGGLKHGLIAFSSFFPCINDDLPSHQPLSHQAWETQEDWTVDEGTRVWGLGCCCWRNRVRRVTTKYQSMINDYDILCLDDNKQTYRFPSQQQTWELTPGKLWSTHSLLIPLQIKRTLSQPWREAVFPLLEYRFLKRSFI